MIKNKFGQLVFTEQDLCDRVMQGHNLTKIQNVVLDPTVDLQRLIDHIEDPHNILTWTFPPGEDQSVPEFHLAQQSNWHMPDEYRSMDIAAHVLSLCATPEQLQRAGQELLLYQERNLFDLLRYLKYLVDVMRENHVIWGVGRGSSVASYVLYLLGVHRIDSMYYDLDPAEFLR